jgi:hypothetical protein
MNIFALAGAKVLISSLFTKFICRQLQKAVSSEGVPAAKNGHFLYLCESGT